MQRPKSEKTRSLTQEGDTDDEDVSSVSSQEHEERFQGESENDVSDEDIETDCEGVKDSDMDIKEANSLTFVCDTLCDFTGEQSEDLSFIKGEKLTVIGIRKDGWWEAENNDGKRGMVPSTFLKVQDKIKKYLEGAQVPDTFEKAQFWEQLRSTVRKVQNVDTALNAFGAFPIGFCHSSFSILLKNDFNYSTQAFLIPKLSSSGLSFEDLHWNMSLGTLKPEITTIQKIVTLVAFRQITTPPPGYDVTSRHVRICLHDGNKVLSNIHTVRARWDAKSPKIWTFNQKVTVRNSSLEDAQIFIRSKKSHATLGVLFELCVMYNKVNADECSEMSCGWVFMRLLNDSGLPVPSRTKVLRVHSGIPFASHQDPSSPANIGALKHFMNRSKLPRMVISISNPKRSSSQQLCYLPTALIGSVCSIPLVTLYRKILADKLFKDRISFDSTELIQSPFLTSFPQVLNEPDLSDVLKKLWHEKLKHKHNMHKKENEKKIAFQLLFMESVFLILQCSNLPPYSIENLQIEQARKAEIERQMKLIYDKQNSSVALSSEIEYQPISIKSLTTNIICRHA